MYFRGHGQSLSKTKRELVYTIDNQHLFVENKAENPVLEYCDRVNNLLKKGIA